MTRSGGPGVGPSVASWLTAGPDPGRQGRHEFGKLRAASPINGGGSDRRQEAPRFLGFFCATPPAGLRLSGKATAPRCFFFSSDWRPNGVSFRSPAGEELETIAIHVGIDSFRAALEATYPGNASEVEVIDFFGRDVALAHLCATCAELLSERVRGSSKIVADLTQLFVTYLAEKYTCRRFCQTRGPRGTADPPTSEGGGFRHRTPCRGDFRRYPGSTGSAQSLPLFAYLQAVDRHVAAAFRYARTVHPCTATHPRNVAQSHRDRARRGLHEPEPFRSNLPACGRCDANGVPQQALASRSFRSRDGFKFAPGRLFRHRYRRSFSQGDESPSGSNQTSLEKELRPRINPAFTSPSAPA
jgi:hypothetical protein